MRVLIIGRHTLGAMPKLPGFDPSRATPLGGIAVRQRPVARTTQAPWYAAVEECRGVQQLIATAGRLARNGQRIDVLDILDHGAPGGIVIGDEILFLSTATGLTIGGDAARALAPFLAEHAHVRLLGCETARLAQGQRLLLDVANALGGRRIVFGTIDRVRGGHFHVERGFTQSEALLYSSLAALDFRAPTSTQRSDHVLAHAAPAPVTARRSESRSRTRSPSRLARSAS
ncbi:MAG: DUF4347 domain-containing protein [Kofleriaceae bacterium]